MIHNAMTGQQCHHCDNGRGLEGFILWGFVKTIDGRPAKERTTSYGVEFGIHNLIACHHLSPAAESMSAHDVMHQFCETNGGEVWLTLVEDDPPWIVRRLELNPDGTEPVLWAFFVNDEAEAHMWGETMQADAYEVATR